MCFMGINEDIYFIEMAVDLARRGLRRVKVDRLAVSSLKMAMSLGGETTK